MNDAAIRAHLDRAVRLAVRGHGGVEPNPMVGCVIVSARGDTIAQGYHHRCGEAHAEIEALNVAGTRARGATAIVTLEPCAHRGRTGPCCDALLAAGITQLIYAVADPNAIAQGGAARLRAAGVIVRHFPHALASELTLPFRKRVATKLPWITAKWAQSIDGAIALASGESQWISGARSRAMVHRERGRVDAILTGIGTVLADNPRLTVRNARAMRTPWRIVFDPDAQLPLTAHLCDNSAPTVILVRARREATHDQEFDERVAALARVGVRAMELGAQDTLTDCMRALAASGIANVMVESGGGVIARLLREDLLDEAFVFIAPFLVGDDDAARGVRKLNPQVLADIPRARSLAARTRGADVLLHYRWRQQDEYHALRE